ncbi:hypothetical protein SAMN04487934_102199 [Eubacterium ruminantium]|nr:hypothetical protein SAMN04487934_102199 [Eubacterium ruminantium]
MRIIHYGMNRIIRDKLSFFLMYFGLILILFALVRSLSITGTLDDLTDFNERYTYMEEMDLWIDWTDYPQNDEEIDRLNQELDSIVLYAWECLSAINADETAVVLFDSLENIFDEVAVFVVVSDKLETKYLELYDDYNDTDVLISHDISRATYKIGDDTYINVFGKRFKVGGYYNYTGVGERGRVVIPWNRLSETDKKDLLAIIISRITSSFHIYIKNDTNIGNEVSEVCRQISDYNYNNKYTIDIGKIPCIDDEKYENYIKVNKSGMANMIIFTGTNFIVILFVWIRRNMRDVSIRKIWGQKPWLIALKQLKDIVVYAILAIPLVMILDIGYSKYLDKDKQIVISLKNFANTGEYVVLAVLVLYLILLLSVYKVNCLDYVREE